MSANVTASERRIPTTHAGSLPRPPALVELFQKRLQGVRLGAGELAAGIEAATRWVVPRQLAAGIDIPNNGEQPRDAFFLYVRHRMSGFAGRGIRPVFADMKRYPGFQAQREKFVASQGGISNFEVPKVTGPIGYLDPANPRLLMRRLRRLFNRAQPLRTEVNILRGILTASVRPRRNDD